MQLQPAGAVLYGGDWLQCPVPLLCGVGLSERITDSKGASLGYFNHSLILLGFDNQAISAFDDVGTRGQCMDPCVKTVTYFGFPFLSDDDIDYAYAKLYFKNIVKVTEDYLSYTFLRLTIKY